MVLYIYSNGIPFIVHLFDYKLFLLNFCLGNFILVDYSNLGKWTKITHNFAQDYKLMYTLLTY
jgi:hypothetical protein